jgi:putative ABC transport system permease protein
VRLALTELRRAKLRYGLLSGAVALLVFLLLFLNTLSGTLLRFLGGAVENISADVLVYDEGARRNLQASRLGPDLALAVAEVAGVAQAEEIGEVTLTARAGAGTTDVSLWGYVPGGPGEPAELVDGRLPRGGEALVDEADVGNGFAIGSTVTLEPSGETLTVVGVTKDRRFSALATLYTPLEGWRGIVAAANPNAPFVPANVVGVRVDPQADPAVVAERITEAVAGAEALDRVTAAASIPGVAAIGQSFGLLVGITFLIVVLVIGFFFLILTVQKLRVFVALRAVGASTGFLARSVLLQIALVVLVAVGLATGLLGVASLTSQAAFPITVDPGLVLAVLAAVLASALLAGGAAVRRIARLDPASAAQIR